MQIRKFSVNHWCEKLINIKIVFTIQNKHVLIAGVFKYKYEISVVNLGFGKKSYAVRDKFCQKSDHKNHELLCYAP